MSQQARRRSHWIVVAVVALVASMLGTSNATADPGGGGQPIDIQFLTVSDWHAQLDPFFDFGLSTNVGGGAVLSSYWAADRAANPNTLTLTAGDAFGASPPLSGFFGGK